MFEHVFYFDTELKVAHFSYRQPIYGQEPETDEAEAAMLIVLYQKTVQLPHLWHVGDLGKAE